MDFRILYKSRRIPTLADSLAKRCQDVIANRQVKQQEYFLRKRGCPEVISMSKAETIAQKKKTQAEKLQAWKKENLRKKEELLKNKKPIFKVGIVQRKVTGSPLVFEDCPKVKKPLKKKNDVRFGVITRSKAKIFEASVNTLSVTEGTEKSNDHEQSIKILEPKDSFLKIDIGKGQPVDSYTFKVPESVSHLPSSNVITFPMSSKTEKVKRGLIHKDKIPCTQSSQFKKAAIDCKDNDCVMICNSSTDETPILQKNNTNFQVKSEKILLTENPGGDLTCPFREYIKFETNRLLETCEKWKLIYKDFPDIPVDIEGEINSVIGKTKLLTSDKFMQFQSLIHKCEKGDPLIKTDDLQGFQDWVSIEVKRIDESFDKLETLKLNGWVSIEKSMPSRHCCKVVEQKEIVKRPVGKSTIRKYIEAARKRMNNEKNKEPVCSNQDYKNEGNLNILKIFEENSLSSEIKSLEKKKNSDIREKSSFSEKIQNSKAQNKIASQVGKTPVMGELNLQKENQKIFSAVECETKNKTVSKKLNYSNNDSLAKRNSKNFKKRERGLNEKYFCPLPDEDESPARFVLGDLMQTTPVRTKIPWNFQKI